MNTQLQAPPPVIPEGYKVAIKCIENKYTYKDYVQYLALHHLPNRITLREYQRLQQELNQ